MARQKQGNFKLKGHTLPGINQKSETKIKSDGVNSTRLTSSP